MKDYIVQWENSLPEVLGKNEFDHFPTEEEARQFSAIVDGIIYQIETGTGFLTGARIA